MNRSLSRIGFLAAVGLAAGALVAGSFLALRSFYWGRVSAVVPGEVYRSAQPSPDDVERAAADLGIASIVNLRGPRPKKRWYKIDPHREAAAASRGLGLVRADLRFQTTDAPPQTEVRRLVRFLDAAERPILLHCESGIDRSGWASAIALLLRGERLGSATKELSLAGGHLCRRSGCHLHRFFDQYAAWLEQSGRAESAAAFREWALGIYAPGPWDAALEPLESPPDLARVEPGSPLRFVVRVTNRSPLPWDTRSSSAAPVRLGARLLGPFDTPPADALELFRIPAGPAADVWRDGVDRGIVPAGGSFTAEAPLAAPLRPGEYALQLDLVAEGVHWFSDLGPPGAIVRLSVAATP
jgi:protein tyrosine phosphatase (PTP) superfamily phosphohydrolase (DUF442 family)